MAYNERISDSDLLGGVRAAAKQLQAQRPGHPYAEPAKHGALGGDARIMDALDLMVAHGEIPPLKRVRGREANGDRPTPTCRCRPPVYVQDYDRAWRRVARSPARVAPSGEGGRNVIPIAVFAWLFGPACTGQKKAEVQKLVASR